MSKSSKEKEEAVLFQPSNREMKFDYPELAEVKEFSELKNNEMKFVWYYASSTSPIKELKGTHRINQSLELAYGKFAARESLGEIRKGNFPVHINNAIAVMKTYRVDYRLRAKLAQEYIFDKMIEVVQVDGSIDSMDFD